MNAARVSLLSVWISTISHHMSRKLTSLQSVAVEVHGMSFMKSFGNVNYFVLCHRLKTPESIPSFGDTKNQRLRSRIWRRNILIIISLKSVPCIDCTRIYLPRQMDFDHVRDVKITNISNLVHHSSKKQLLEEIAKCEVVCAVCHRIRTHGRKHR